MLELGRVEVLLARAEGANGPHAEAARIALERAVELDPEQPEGHAVLARFYADMAQDARGAIASFERARALGAWSPSLEVALAQQYVAVGERVEAMALLRPVAASTHGGRFAKEARRLLQSLREAERGSALPAPAQAAAALSSSRPIN